MRMAAERSGGFYVDGNREDAVSVIAAYMRSVSLESGTRGGGREKKQRWFLFLVIALAAYGGSKLSLLRLRSRRILSGLAVLLLFSSCSRVSGRLLIMEANFLSSRGKYNEAVSSYLKALEHEEVLPYAEYGLGSVYYSLDEGKAALERFAASQKILENQPPAMHRELRYRNYYNSGLAFFGAGDFPEAAAAFREALRTDPARIEAKRNLELSLLSLEKEKSAASRAEGGAEESLSRAVLFEYLRQKEQSRWKSRDWAPEEQSAGADY
jgi:Ca-activated chloride channel family protein